MCFFLLFPKNQYVFIYASYIEKKNLQINLKKIYPQALYCYLM